MTNVISFDPGKETGIAYHGGGTSTPATWSFAEEDTHQYIAYSMPLNPIDVVVCENYIQQPGAFTPAPWSLKWIGVLEHWCWERDITFVLQSRDIKSQFPNALLRKMGWWVVGSKGHDIDALRHLAYYLKTQRDPFIIKSVLEFAS